MSTSDPSGPEFENNTVSEAGSLINQVAHQDVEDSDIHVDDCGIHVDDCDIHDVSTSTTAVQRHQSSPFTNHSSSITHEHYDEQPASDAATVTVDSNSSLQTDSNCSTSSATSDLDGVHSSTRTSIISSSRSIPCSIHNTRTGWWKSLMNNLPQGWRFGLLCYMFSSLLVFFLNLTLLIYTLRCPTSDSISGVGALYEGSCTKTRSITMWLQAIFNLLSTILLSGSNYTVQCLLSPTREDLDRAHGEGRWLHVGLSTSLKNYRRLGKGAKLLGGMMWMASLGLHFLYNSSVFATTYAHAYQVSIVPENTISSPPALPMPPQENSTDPQIKNRYFGLIDVHTAHESNSSWKTFEDPMECLDAYDNRFPSRYGNVILVIQGTNLTTPMGIYYSFFRDITPGSSTNFWLACPHLGDSSPTTLEENGCEYRHPTSAHKARGNWTFHDGNMTMTVKYCRAEKRAEKCAVQFSQGILSIVLICTVVKMLGMVVVFWRKSCTPLITIGDVLQSYLIHPDPFTKGICYADRKFFDYRTTGTPRSDPWNSGRIQPSVWKTQGRLSRTWANSASKTRWCTVVIPIILLLVVTGGALVGAISALEHTSSRLKWDVIWERGFGEVYTDSFIPLNLGFYENVVYANMPQVVLSYIYLMYNSLFTVMVTGEEWNHFGGERKTLRVTDPKGQQRSTYWLQLPYKYAVPLIVTSGIIHWTTSQSIFLAQLKISHSLNVEYTSVHVCFSILGIVVSLGIGVGMLIVLVMMGLLRKYGNDMPLLGNCSAVVSAACHSVRDNSTQESREEMALKPLQWGDVGFVDESTGLRHLSFGDEDVAIRRPLQGARYAGKWDGKLD